MNRYKQTAVSCYHHGGEIMCHQLWSTVWSKKTSPFSFTAVSTVISQFLEYLAAVCWVCLQHSSYWFTHLTYVLLLHYLGKITYVVETTVKWKKAKFFWMTVYNRKVCGTNVVQPSVLGVPNYCICCCLSTVLLKLSHFDACLSCSPVW